MIRQTTNNDILKNALKDRDLYFDFITQNLENMEDSDVNKYYIFKKKYNALSPLEKDLWFLETQYKRVQIAQMYNVSRGYITILLKKLHEKI